MISEASSSKTETLTETPKGAMSVLSKEGTDYSLEPLRFTRNEEYTTFIGEHVFDGNDIVFHFFKSPELAAKAAVDQVAYWKNTFPDALSQVAQDVFQAGYPRLKATYTQEVDSWWMRAYGFAVEGMPDDRVRAFYDNLDAELEKKSK